MSQAKKEEALEALERSRLFYREGNVESALRVAQKSNRICETAECTAWIRKLQREAQPQQEAVTGTPEQREQVRSFQESRSGRLGDPYAVLGVTKGSCSDDDVKRAYKKLALLFHPDKNCANGADEIFKQLAKAYSLISDAGKRASFDRFGTETHPGGYSAAGAEHFQDFNPEDVFRMFFSQNFSYGGFSPLEELLLRTQRHQRPRSNEGGASSGSSGGLSSKLLRFAPVLIFFLISYVGSWIQERSEQANIISNVLPEHIVFPDLKSSYPTSYLQSFARSHETAEHRVAYLCSDVLHNALFQRYSSRSELAKYEGCIERHYKNRLRHHCKKDPNGYACKALKRLIY